MPKVSIIIPAYNQGRFLSKAVESCLTQTFSDLEVIVVDDGSTDNTSAIAAHYLVDHRFKYVKQQNAGAPAARNRGLKESAGDYLCYLDSDDYLLPQKIARQAALLDREVTLGWTYCDLITVDENDCPTQVQLPVSSYKRRLDGDIFESLMAGGYFPPHVVMVRREVMDAIGSWDESLGGHCDYDVWLRIAGTGYPVKFQPDKLAVYRIHASSMSSNAAAMARTRLATFAKIARLFPDRTAASLEALQGATHELFASNQRLHAELNSKSSTLSSQSSEAEAFDLISLLPAARREVGETRQIQAGMIDFEGAAPALCLRPPAAVAFDIPVGDPGRFATAIGMHPSVWTKPESGGCEYSVRIDGRIAFAMIIDPIHASGDRRWHELVLEVPSNPAGRHSIILQTKGVGSNFFRWALWRTPRFVRKLADPTAGERPWTPVTAGS